MLIYNSVTREKTEFAPVKDGEVSMYVCGPTVYDDSHIGHVVGPVLFDCIAKWMSQRGYKVRFVNNITDIDDKIINRAIKTGEDWREITIRYTQQYLDLLAALQVSTITDHPKATEFIDPMIAYIDDLVQKDRAYPTSDGVYFRIEAQEDYGKLSGRNPDDMKAGARIDRNSELQHPGDFCLWKLAKPGEPSWSSPWGDGRPGWHIECSVMSSELLGGTFDIHGGGDDLKFPHHENEIAQAEAHGDSYAQCWMHNGLVQYEGAKVSKSDPRMKDTSFSRQFKALYLVDTYGADTLRFLILRGHYRRPIDFAPEQLKAAETSLRRLQKQISQTLGLSNQGSQSGQSSQCSDNKALINIPTEIATIAEIAAALPAAQSAVDRFTAAMDDDFNTGAAMSTIFSLAGLTKKSPESDRQILAQVVAGLAGILGLDLTQVPEKSAPAGDQQADAGLVDNLMQLVIDLRQQARAQRDFATADKIRDHLAETGIVIRDGADGSTWEQQ